MTRNRLLLAAAALGAVLLVDAPGAAQVPLGSEWGRLLARRRALQLDRLHAYALAGRFPVNTAHPGRRAPYFISGSPCAMAHLVIEDGREDLARGTAAADNNVRIAELDGGPLVDWILGSGLLQEEAARVQPTYRHMPGYKERRERFMREVARVRAHLLEVEGELRRKEERSLELAERRLKARMRESPAFAARMRLELEAERRAPALSWRG